tara:strand:+ start:174 stop:455 length:282 start_codon:yes stop_codon:yes gene_type:complete
MVSLKEITSRLKIAKNKINNSNDNNANSRSTYIGTAFKISTEFVVTVAVSTIIGFILDSLFDTKPWLIIFFFIIGVVAGIRSIVKTAKMMQEK